MSNQGRCDELWIGSKFSVLNYIYGPSSPSYIDITSQLKVKFRDSQKWKDKEKVVSISSKALKQMLTKWRHKFHLLISSKQIDSLLLEFAKLMLTRNPLDDICRISSIQQPHLEIGKRSQSIEALTNDVADITISYEG
ncbi:hypothetical protein K2173_020138 [Erythroxylum novogranatense]|uniref:Uncharacterized protein n=1 Tax=Erythroxylum novogranatense TaxID=1862640 RepID=A0AAV8UAB5_9ROSI|nr:hypothetical protein K2173_020138 [Erythroxylum novogranatense]